MENIYNLLSLKSLRLMKWCDSIIIWFASFHALPFILINKLFNKKIYIIAGGYDVANIPNIKYGSMMKGFRRKMGQWILKHTTNVIAVSNSNKNEILRNTHVPPNRIKLIYNAIELKNQKENFDKKTQILTVGEIN